MAQAAHLVLQLEQRLGLVAIVCGIDDLLKPVLVLIRFLADQAAFAQKAVGAREIADVDGCLLYTSPSPRDS